MLFDDTAGMDTLKRLLEASVEANVVSTNSNSTASTDCDDDDDGEVDGVVLVLNKMVGP